MPNYFVSYLTVFQGDATRPHYGWHEVSFDGPVTGGDVLLDLTHALVADLAERGWIKDGDALTVLNWRRFEEPL